jgi:hypothetical protein
LALLREMNGNSSVKDGYVDVGREVVHVHFTRVVIGG